MMGGGREIPMLTCTSAIVGIGMTIADSRRIVPKSSFFILSPPVHSICPDIEPLCLVFYSTTVCREPVVQAHRSLTTFSIPIDRRRTNWEKEELASIRVSRCERSSWLFRLSGLVLRLFFMTRFRRCHTLGPCDRLGRLSGPRLRDWFYRRNALRC
jgi:hypothetical protein